MAYVVTMIDTHTQTIESWQVEDSDYAEKVRNVFIAEHKTEMILSGSLDTLAEVARPLGEHVTFLD